MVYALADVTHLRDIYKALVAQIARTGRWDWVEDENRVLQSIDTYVVKPTDAWERLKARLNRPRDLAALMALADWREKRAQDDRPAAQPRAQGRRAVRTGHAAADATPASSTSCAPCPGAIGRSSAGRRDRRHASRRSRRSTSPTLPRLPERYRGPSPKGAVGDLIRVLLKAVAEREGVAARIIATCDDIDAIVLDDEADVPALKGWRRKLFGDKALAIKHGRIGLGGNGQGRRRDRSRRDCSRPARGA